MSADFSGHSVASTASQFGSSRFSTPRSLDLRAARRRRVLRDATRPCFGELLERRVMLAFSGGTIHQSPGGVVDGQPSIDAVVPNTTPLNIASNEVKAILQTAAEVGKLQQEVDGIHDKLAPAIGKLPLVGTKLKDVIDASTDAFNGVSTGVQNALNIAHGERSVLPEDAENPQFRFGRPALFRHAYDY